MKKSLITIACAAVAPIAFAQTSTTVTEQTTSAPATTTTTSTTYETGMVSTYTPGKTIVVKREHEGPVSFALGTAARVVDGAGKIVTAPLRAGQRCACITLAPATPEWLSVFRWKNNNRQRGITIG